VRTNRNEIEFDADVVRRFPLTQPDIEDLPNIARRHEAARSLGFPVPRVLGVREDHLVLERAAGAPLVETPLRPEAQRRLGHELAGLLARLRAVTSWPLPARSWPRLWSVLDDLVGTPETGRAALVAASAPVRLTHGDLSWGNLLVTGEGELVAVIDWDGATLADPAQDFAALCANVEPEVASVIRGLTPDADLLTERANAYMSTWAIQNELWEAGRHPWLGG
jgi:aminoglycoside phosphotransferase (APT) family kinase protein